MKDPLIKQQVKRSSQGHQWGAQLRREFDTLVRATEGMGVTALFEAIATEAIIADNGELHDSTGWPGTRGTRARRCARGQRTPPASV